MKTRTPAAFALAALLQRGDSTVADFASAMSVSSRTVYRWCDGTGNPSNAQAQMIEAWTAGAVRPRAWLTDIEHAALTRLSK